MEEHTLTKIEIITRPSKLEELKEALNKIGVMVSAQKNLYSIKETLVLPSLM